MGRIRQVTIRYLIDTSILLWDLMDDPRLNATHSELLLGDDPKFVSIATLWEIAIKVAVGKLRMPQRLLQTLRESDVQLLDISPEHALHCAAMPLHHGDPFDRMLIAQAQLEKMTVLTSDRHFALYDVLLA